MSLFHIFDLLVCIACYSFSVACIDLHHRVQRYTFSVKIGFNRLNFRASPVVFYSCAPFVPFIIGTCNAPLIRLNSMTPNQTNGNLLGFGPTTCFSHQSRQDRPYTQYVRSRYTLPYFLLHMCLLTAPIQYQEHVSACCSSFVLAPAAHPARYRLHFVLCVSICDSSCVPMPTVRPA